MSTVLVERRGPVAILTLNRPEHANAFNAELRAEMAAAKDDLAADPSIRVVIVTGAGRHFCGGADLREPRKARAEARRRYPGAADVSTLPQPVIAAINGAALGGGCELALICDFRFAAAGAEIGLPEIRFGALPIGGGIARLTRLCGLSAARRLVLTGEPVPAEQALPIGLVDRVVPAASLLDAAEAFARELATSPAFALRTAKRLLNTTLDLDLSEAMALERELVRGMASREELAQARADAAERSGAYRRIFRPDPGERQREAWEAGVLPPVEEVRPGLWSIPVTIPGSRMRYVLSYAFALPDGVGLVDPGWDADEAWDGLVKGLGAAGFDVADVRAVVATHVHGDHYGLASRIRRASGAWIGLHAEDAAMIADPADEAMRDELDERWAEMRRRLGAPSAARGPMTDRKAKKYIPSTRPDRLLADGSELDLAGWRWRVIWTPGHSPGHVSLYESGHRLLLAGDHVLPRITPSVAVHSRQRPDPLGDYLRSLGAVRDLPVDEVLPAHEHRFTDLAGRVDQILAHHQAKLADIEQVLADQPGLTCWEIAAKLRWSRPFAQLPGALRHSAARETLAHLVVLERRGAVSTRDEDPPRWYLSG